MCYHFTNIAVVLLGGGSSAHGNSKEDTECVLFLARHSFISRYQHMIATLVLEQNTLKSKAKWSTPSRTDGIMQIARLTEAGLLCCQHVQPNDRLLCSMTL